MVRILIAIGVLVLLGLGTSFIIEQKSGASHKAETHPLPVVTRQVRQDDFKIYISSLGLVTPEYSVMVKPQISGQLIKILFTEGQTVKAGDVLAEIDPRSYRAELLQYEGQLARDVALLENAKIDLSRYQLLWEKNSVSRQILDTQIALVNQYEGVIQLDQGLVEIAKVNLSYCTITAPIDGQVGLRLIDEGNLIQAGSNSAIAVINTLDPIGVLFSVSGDVAPKIIQKFSQNQPLIVEIYNSELGTLLTTGKLIAIDNQIDQTTGTIKLKSQFDNSRNILFPNQFVNVKLLLDTLEQATIIPTAAIEYGPNGAFVYKLEEENKVKIIPVEIVATSGDDTVIATPLAKDTEVVVQGADKLTDGATVSASRKT
jgi:multidrug efflux system membrane fusion protein